MLTVLADLRYAARVIGRAPSFAVAVISVLAIGIGANTALFSIVNAVLLRPLPFEQPEQLVRLFTKPPQTSAASLPIFGLSPGKFYDWQRDSTSFEGMALYRFRQFALSGSGSARAIVAGAVGAGFFDTLHARPARGRVFLPEEDTTAGKHVAIVSERFWKSELGAAADVVGRTLTLDDEAYTIVGVMPANATVAAWEVMASDIWVPLALTQEQRAVRSNHNQRGFARLKPGVTVEQAQAEMDAISARLAQEFPASDGRWGAVVMPMREEIVGDSRRMLVMLLGAVALVLLIACANVGNLLFTRALTRRKELAIRSALGAGRARVFQQLLTEAVVYAAMGGALGLVLAAATLSSVSTVLANQIPRAAEITIDGRVLLFAIAASLLTGILAGTLPAIRAGRADVNDALKEGGRGDAAVGVGTRRLLIVCEVALSLVLLMSAGVMIQSLLALRQSNTGFDLSNVLTMEVSLVATRYQTPAQRTAFYDAALERIRALPGVEAAATIDDLPLLDGSSQTLALEGSTAPAQSDPVAVQVRQVTPGYLETMRIPVLRGRDVAGSDNDVLLVSREAAKLYWGTDDPIGRRAALPAISRTMFREVVGIVGDVKQRDLADNFTPTVYYYSRNRAWAGATFVIRTSVPPATLAQPATAAIHAIDPQQPVQNVQTMERIRDERLSSQRLSALLLGVFAGIALLLASIGIYSVVSYIVRGRSREIGIRAALGARTSDVLALVIVEGMTPTLIGILVGTIAAFASASILERLVFGVSAYDAVTLGVVAVTLGTVALVACIVPAYRAAQLDPLRILREP